MFNIADDIFEKINCFGVGHWLGDLALKLGFDLQGQNLSPGSFHTTNPGRGLILTIGRTDQSVPDNKDALYLYRVQGGPSAPMPFGLNPVEETLSSAMSKLSRDTAGGEASDRRVSFFLNEGKVIELQFNEGMTGFGKILMAGLGGPHEWNA